MSGRLRAGRLLAATAVAAATAIAAATADRASATPGASPRQPVGSGVQLELIDQNFSLPADGLLNLEYRITGDLTIAELLPTPEPAPSTTLPADDTTEAEPEVPPPLPLSLTVRNYGPLRPGVDPSRFVGPDVRTRLVYDEAIDGVFAPNVRSEIILQDDGTAILPVTVGTDSGESIAELLKFDEPGLYPIVVELIAGPLEDDVVLARHGTIVQRIQNPGSVQLLSPPIDLSVVAAIPETTAEPSDAEIASAGADLGPILDMTATIANPATLSIPPVVLAAATDADPDRVATSLADDELVSVPATPLDVSSAAAVGLVDEFARRLGEGEDLITATVPTKVAGRDVWIATAPLSAAGAQAVRDLGFRYVVMTPSRYRSSIGELPPATDLFVDIALPAGGTLPLLVVDELSEQLTTEATDAILADRTATEWGVATIADLILDRGQEDRLLSRSRVLSSPDLTALDPRLITRLETLAQTTPDVRFAPASTLTAFTDTQSDDDGNIEVELPDEAGPDLSERVDLLDAAALTMLSAASMLPDGDERPAGWFEEIDGLISTGYTDDEVAARIDDLVAEADVLKGSVVPPESFTFTLTGRSGDIDLRVGNSSDEPLSVLLSFESPKLEFPEGDQVVELAPNDQTLVVVPVRARANGTSAVNVTTLTPAGEEIAEPVVLTSRVNALTGFAQVLTGGLILVLLTWWFSNWRKRKRAAAASAAAAVAARHPSNGR